MSATGDFGRPPGGRMRTSGTILLGAGWLVLSAALAARIAGIAGPIADWAIVLTLGACLIATGATLIVVAALTHGFGALDRFFQEALARSSRRAAEPVKPPPEPDPSPFAEQHGLIGDRPYVVYGDGTVAVETLLGVRRFASMVEAQEFIGA